MTFKKSGKYSVSLNEDFESGSNNEVLKNYLGIKSKEEMELLEEKELERTESELLNIGVDHQFTADDICNMHDLWLGDIYPFAGKYRTVNMAKGDFTFASANLIEKLMKKFESEFLAKYTPCHFSNIDDLAFALGVVHVELILIHPFREGNGRLARLLADLMSMQAKKPPLDYAPIDQTTNHQGFENYILAIHTGMDGNYEPIKKIFKMLLKESV